MRGHVPLQPNFVSLINVETLIPEKHPIRVIKQLCDEVLKGMSAHFDEIYAAFLKYTALLFRSPGKPVTREQHIAFSRRFGELDRHDSLPRDRHPDYPELLLVSNIPEKDGKESASKYTGQQWHSDMSFTLEPSLGSLLRGITIPPVGGDTMFTNMYMAYDTLSDGSTRFSSS